MSYISNLARKRWIAFVPVLVLATACGPSYNATREEMIRLQNYCVEQALKSGIPAGAQESIGMYVQDCIKTQLESKKPHKS